MESGKTYDAKIRHAKGSCLCGSITYHLELPAETTISTSLCHCRPCRKISGSTTSVNLIVPSASFILDSGDEAKLKTIRTKHIDEGFDFTLSFCTDCGSPIYAIPHWTPQPDIKVIQAGTLDDGEVLETVPGVESNVKWRVPWLKRVEGAEQRTAYAKE